MALKHVNAIVIGAGAGGGVVAKELSEAGLSVVLFERGKWHSYEDVERRCVHNARRRGNAAAR
jgi:choline dehydrogenase-like flavoprotein